MTANALADNMSECYSHGMDSFIAKPVTFTKLQQALKQFIPCPDVTGSPTGKSNPTGDVQTSTFHWKNRDGRGDEG
jgi:DNA-binding NtrC family response regulator